MQIRAGLCLISQLIGYAMAQGVITDQLSVISCHKSMTTLTYLGKLLCIGVQAHVLLGSQSMGHDDDRRW